MVVNKSCVAACLESVRMAVESVSGCSWSECPDQRGITVRMCVEWVSESAWNPQQDAYSSFCPAAYANVLDEWITPLLRELGWSALSSQWVTE